MYLPAINDTRIADIVTENVYLARVLHMNLETASLQKISRTIRPGNTFTWVAAAIPLPPPSLAKVLSSRSIYLILPPECLSQQHYSTLKMESINLEREKQDDRIMRFIIFLMDHARVRRTPRRLSKIDVKKSIRSNVPSYEEDDDENEEKHDYVHEKAHNKYLIA